MNRYAIRVIYQAEMRRAFETVAQSFASPVLTTVLYFVVFGSAPRGSACVALRPPAVMHEVLFRLFWAA